MKAIDKSVIQLYEEVAVDGLKAMRKYFRSEKSNESLFQRAKIGAVACANYVRLQATETNRAAVQLAASRLAGGAVNAEPPRLGEGDSVNHAGLASG